MVREAKMTRGIYSILSIFMICACVSSSQIHAAVKENDLDQVQEYVRNGDIERKDSNGFTPLILASYFGHTSIVRYLLEQGANVDQRDNNGWTALLYASYYNYYDIALILLDHNASVNMQNSEGHTALYYAEQFRYDKTTEILNEKGAKSY
jgi:ankyrin repeat protein